MKEYEIESLVYDFVSLEENLNKLKAKVFPLTKIEEGEIILIDNRRVEGKDRMSYIGSVGRVVPQISARFGTYGINIPVDFQPERAKIIIFDREGIEGIIDNEPACQGGIYPDSVLYGGRENAKRGLMDMGIENYKAKPDEREFLDGILK